MEETTYLVGAFILGVSAGVVLAMQYYGTMVHEMTKANLMVITKLQTSENRPASEREIEYFKRGGHVALQTVHDFAKHRLEIDPAQLKEIMGD